MKGFFLWLRSVFSESGDGSFARVCSYTVVVIALAICTAVTRANSIDPQHKIDIPPQVVVVLLALIGKAAFDYGAGKFAASRVTAAAPPEPPAALPAPPASPSTPGGPDA